MATRSKSSGKVESDVDKLNRLLAGDVEAILEKSLKGGNLSDKQLAKYFGVSEAEIAKAKSDLEAWKKQNEGKQVPPMPDAGQDFNNLLDGQGVVAVWNELYGKTHNPDGSPKTAGSQPAGQTPATAPQTNPVTQATQTKGQPTTPAQAAAQAQQQASGAKPAKAGKGGKSGKGNEAQAKGEKKSIPWYMKRGSGFARLVFGGGRGSVDPLYSTYGTSGGGSGVIAGGAASLPESVQALIDKGRRRRGGSPSKPSSPSAPASGGGGGGSAPSGGGGSK